MSESGNGRYKPRRKATRAARSSRSGNRSTPPPAESTPPAPPEPPRYAPRSDESPFWANAPKGGSESPFWAGGNQSRPATPQYAPRGALPSYTTPDTTSGLPTRPADGSTTEARPGETGSGLTATRVEALSPRRPAGGTPSWVEQSIGTDPEPARARRAARSTDSPATPSPLADSASRTSFGDSARRAALGDTTGDAFASGSSSRGSSGDASDRAALGEPAGNWSSRRAADDWASLAPAATSSGTTPDATGTTPEATGRLSIGSDAGLTADAAAGLAAAGSAAGILAAAGDATTRGTTGASTDTGRAIAAGEYDAVQRSTSYDATGIGTYANTADPTDARDT
ncbi:MAG TPA: hypothetical protein VG497_28050, partial [Kribbella sp.]|nr:hypothetical protein [Kribbella sp.]